MLSHTRAHRSFPDHRLDPSHVAITVLITLLFLAFLFLFLTLTATPAQGQNRTAPTAVQAAKMPQFAAKLGHPMGMRKPDNASRIPAEPRASYKTPTDPRTWFGHGGPLDSSNPQDAKPKQQAP